MFAETSTLFIGHGRLSSNWSHYLQLLGHSTAFATRQDSESEWIEKVQSADLIALSVQDSLLPETAEKVLKLTKKPVLHFSGALNIPGVFGFHPLSAFSGRLKTLAELEQIPLITSDDFKIKNYWSIPNPIHLIKPEQKTMYHFLCVYGGNLSCLLWQDFFRGLESLGLPKEVGIPYLRQVTENLAQNPLGALTGPLQRKDLSTIEKHLSVLPEGQEKDIYQTFLIHRGLLPRGEQT